MVQQAGTPRSDETEHLAESRTQFVSSLGRRLDGLRQALADLERSPRSRAHRDNLRRRVHALAAAAGVLGFDTVVSAFKEIEQILNRSAMSDPVTDAALGRVARTIDLVPSLVLGAQLPNFTVHESALRPKTGGFPLSVLLFGAEPLAEALAEPPSSSATPIECERTEDPGRAEELVRVVAPDVAVIDADRAASRDLIETLMNDPLLDPIRLIAVGSFDRPEAAAGLVSLGVARVLPKPVSSDTLRRTVREVARDRVTIAPHIEPIGDVTVEALSERLALEVHRGLVDAVKPHGRPVSVPLGEATDVLAAVWAAVARVRELVTMRSGGAVRFDATGPEGAVPLAPWAGEEPRRALSAGRSLAKDVSLAGRRAVVVDDDPAVAWFLSGLLRAANVEVLEAHDGKRALELARANWPDVIISDVLMPVLDGFGLCREIKRDIALSDTPVILLSWKEDLLQRMRDLGAEADAYLRKEATGSTVLDRIREVLAPRARVEARVAKGGEVRGRLDGLTPRLVLEVVCRRRMSAKVTFRDAAYLYEVEVRSGRLRTATRTAVDGRSDRGEPVLAGLLGVRAGRFVIVEDVSECRRDFDGTLSEVLEAPVHRARSRQRVLNGASLLTVGRVELDMQALGPYLSATPGEIKRIVDRIHRGAPPRDLLSEGTPTHLMETVLADVVTHAGVVAVKDDQGKDLLEAVREAEAEVEAERTSERGLEEARQAALGAQRGLGHGEETPVSPAQADESAAAAEESAAAADIELPQVRPIGLPDGLEQRSKDRGGVSRKESSAVVKLAEIGEAVPEPEPPEPELEPPQAGVDAPPKTDADDAPDGRAFAFSLFEDIAREAAAEKPPKSEPISSRSKGVAPGLSEPQPSPFEAALQSIQTDVLDKKGEAPPPSAAPPRDSTPDIEEVDSGWHIALEDQTGSRSGSGEVEKKAPGRAFDPLRPAIRPETTKKPVAPGDDGGLDLGQAVMSAMDVDDGDPILLENRTTVRPEDRVTTRPVEPTPLPPEALRPAPRRPAAGAPKPLAKRELRPEPPRPAGVKARALGRDPKVEVRYESIDDDDPLFGILASSEVDATPAGGGAEQTEPELLDAAAAERRVFDEAAAEAAVSLLERKATFGDSFAQPDEPVLLAPSKRIRFPRHEPSVGEESAPLGEPSRDEDPIDEMRHETTPFTPEPDDAGTDLSDSAKPVSVSPRAAVETAERASEPGQPPIPLRSRTERALDVARVVAYTAVAFVVSFGAVRAIKSVVIGSGGDGQAEMAEQNVGESRQLEGAEQAAPGRAAAAAQPAPSVAARPQGSALEAKTGLPLPTDVAVTGGKGLLDVATGGEHSIYVDGVFVGRGPIRRVPVVAGDHDVRLTLEGQEQTYRVKVEPGRRTSLAPSEPGQ